jgi:carbamoylphosphate synthase small subunit
MYRGFRVVRYPCWSDPSDVVRDAKGIIISNGPGNPLILREVIENMTPPRPRRAGFLCWGLGC